MKTMKKIWISICSFLFMLALGLGITLNTNVKAKAATGDAVEVGFQYAAVIVNQDGSKVCHFVTDDPTTDEKDSISTPERGYQFPVYFNGNEVTAWTDSGTFIVDYDEIGGEAGDTYLLEILADTQYQSNKYVKNDISILIAFTGTANGNEIKRTESNIISKTPYSIQLNRLDWAMNASNASNLYATIVDPDNTIKSGVAKEDWSNGAKYAPLGNAITVNGVAINKNIQKVYADPSQDAYIQLASVSKPGDVLTFDGWFYNATHGAFRIEKTSFIYDGKSWDEENSGTYDLEVSTTSDANPQKGFYLSMPANHIPVSTDNSGWSYSTRPVGTNFYGYHNSTNVAIKFRKFSVTDWYVALNETGITAVAGDTVSWGGWYVCTDANSVQYFIKLNSASYQFDGTKWTNITPTISVSVNGTAVENTIYVAPGQSVSDVTATASNSNAVTMNFGEAVSDNAFVLRRGESKSDYLATFSVTDSNGVIYTKKLAVRVGFEDFAMENGAAVRVNGDEVNGLRFSAEMSADTYNSLKAQGATFGIVIVPRDYITEGYELTAANLFGANAKYSATATVGASQTVRRMLLLDNLTPSNRDSDSNYELYGAITDILNSNLTREFVGVAYAYVNGEYIVASYYGNDMDNNARSIYYVAQRAVDANDNASKVQEKYIDTYNQLVEDAGKTYNVGYTVNHIRTRKGVMEVETENLTGVLNSTVEIAAKEYDGFALTSGVAGVTIKLYANKPNVVDFYYKDISLPDMDVTAWHHPKLDDTDNYMNDTNKAIAETMRDAGFTSVMLNGSHTVGDLYLNSPANIETMKNIITMFWTYGGISTYVSGKNAGTTSEYVSLEDYQALQTEMATLLDCDGFGGFFAWDEPLPNASSMARIAEYAAWFDGLYGDEALFMVNLFPSYYDGWGSGDYTSYADYIKAYCDIVLPNIENGTKYLSMDSYPIYADGTLMQGFMYDLAVLKHYALEYGAQANAILQGCGWTSTNNNVAPTEAQYRLMYYTALAFGMDSIGWWGYSPETDAEDSTILPDQTPVKIDGTTTAAYDDIKKVNTEVAAFGPIYKTYTWQGVIMSSPSAGFIGIGKDAQYDAFNKVKSDSLLSKYMLSASSTASFSSVSGSGSNYVMSVMKDKNNNEAFAVVNYSAPTDNKTLTLTLKAKADGQYIIYKGGEQTTETITTSGYKLILAPGEGAFIMNANTTHSVTFKNWDGTTLYETTCQVGNTPTYGAAEPTRDGYTFTGWTPALGAITDDTVYTATFKGLPTITFQNWDGTVLQQSTWSYGATPSYNGATPTKNGAEFAGWTPEITTVTGDATYTAIFNEFFTVTYENWDGTTASKTEKVQSGSLISYTPTLDDYIFKGWTKDGEAYDMTTAVTEDITLVAKWAYVDNNGAKSVISAEEISQTVSNNDFASQVSYDKEANWSWYYDTDYLFSPSGNDIEENCLWNRAQFVANSTKIGANTISLPKINFAQYSKVDFGFVSSIDTSKGNITDVQLNGVSGVGYENRLIHIAPDSAGKYYATVYEVNKTTVLLKVELSEAVVKGQEALTFTVVTDGEAYAWVKITELHVRSRINDYQAVMADSLSKLPASADELTDEHNDAINAYLVAEQYLTEYELASYATPAIILAAQENNLYNAVVNATAGSAEQAAAIEEYRAFIQEHEISNSLHIAAINTIIYQNFYELEEEQILLNDPTVDTSKGAVDQNERIQTGWGGHNTDYNTSYETYVHMIQFTSGDYDSTVTLPAINYNSYAQAYFGLRAITAGGIGTITIGDGSYSFDSSKNHNWKVTIVGNILTVSDDNKSNNDGGGVLWTTVLSDDVANGEAGLVIDFNFKAWTQVEITEMRVIGLKMSEEVLVNDPTVDTSNGAVDQGERIQTGWGYAHNDYKSQTYDYIHMVTTNSANATGSFTLNAFNYNAYDEVYFGLYAIAAAVTWDSSSPDFAKGGGVITIGDQSFAFDTSKAHYFKLTIKNGILTMSDDSTNNNDGGGVIFSVALSEAIANGTESLVIGFAFDVSGSQTEITAMHVLKKAQKVLSAELNNAPSVNGALNNGTPNSIKTYKSATYTNNYWILFRTQENNNFDGTVTFSKVNYKVNKEVYFGMYVLLDAEQWSPSRIDQTATITINGQSWSITSNPQEHWYKVRIAEGVLTVTDDSTSNADAGATVLRIALPENVLNGTEALSIDFNFGAYAEVQTTSMHTNTWVDPLS